jgi:superfamily II DNA helicase RecQ
VLFYSWVDVLSWDRLAEDSDPAVRAWQRRQSRTLFRLVEEGRCRHESLVGYFGEAIAPCQTACDLCTGEPLAFERKARSFAHGLLRRRKGRSPKRRGG